MNKNIPSPCCGLYDVSIESNIEHGIVWYKAKCPKCGFGTSDVYDSRQEAVYEYEQMCINTWKKNRNGLSDWMKKQSATPEESARRIRIIEDMKPYIMGLK